MQTRDAFMDSVDFDPEEAMEAVVDKKKNSYQETFKKLQFP